MSQFRPSSPPLRNFSFTQRRFPKSVLGVSPQKSRWKICLPNIPEEEQVNPHLIDTQQSKYDEDDGRRLLLLVPLKMT